jgi:hypothetical protein
MKTLTSLCAAAGALLLPAFATQAQGVGVASIGAVGGLHIPSAYVLGAGDAALSLGDDHDPQLGTYNQHRNYTLGFGLGGGVELFGRLNHIQNMKPGETKYVGGDISGNLKWQLPIEAAGLPKLAVGFTDQGGEAAVYFRSLYAVASDELGPLRWSLGYGQSEKSVVGKARVLDGVFGGAELRLWDTRATLLAETDGTRRHAGVRYYSPVLPWLGDSQVVGSVQRSFGGTALAGKSADATSFKLSLIVPLQTDDATRQQRSRSAAQAHPPLPALAASGNTPAPTRTERLATLHTTLRAAGLERVRVGTLGDNLVVEYENQRYLHNEVDALGIVLGLAAEHAPANSRRLHVITRKTGLVVSEASVSVPSYRAWLRDAAESSAVQATLGFGPLPGYDADAVQWERGSQQATHRVRVALSPLLNYTVGTEIGLFDYSVALQARTSVPLWTGAEAYADVVQRIDNSVLMEPGAAFANLRHRNGLQTLALQQSFWLGQHALASVGAGLYQYNTVGLEAEATMLVPGRNEDSVHLRARAVHLTDSSEVPGTFDASSASYRWRMSPSTWLEGGLHSYTDGSKGPALALTRWFGDVALQLFAREGGGNRFVGLELSLPLTPRQGMGAQAIQLSGNPRFALPFRTLLTSDTDKANAQRPNAVRPVDLSYKSEVELLNSGRMTPDYLGTQLPRLRESFYLYGRGLMP